MIYLREVYYCISLFDPQVQGSNQPRTIHLTWQNQEEANTLSLFKGRASSGKI
jgi:hypothetical protein